MGKKEIKPLVSVVITTKNEEAYIEKTLQSVKNQTYKNLEIIVSDACSSDKTVQIAKKYGSKVIIKDTNIAQGRNAAVKLAKGEILAFVDADTILNKHWIKKVVDHFRNKDLVAVLGSPDPMKTRNHREKILNILTCWHRLAKFLGLPVVGVCSIGFAIRKDIFEKIHGFREDLFVAEDTDLELRARRVGKVIIESEIKNSWSWRRFEKGGYVNWIYRWLKTYIAYLINKKTPDYYPMYR